MRVSAIRTSFKKRPFRPLDLVLDNGEHVRLASPEVLVFDDAIVTGDEHGKVLLVAPESVSIIRVARNGVRR